MRLLYTAIAICWAFLSYSQVTFVANVTEGCVPVGVTINVTSPPATDISSYFWEITYPDGSVETSASPLYVDILSDPGSYDVSLTINGTDNLTIEDYITVHELPEAEFSVDDGIGCFPLCVNFSDISISGGGDIVEWSWDFGNGITSDEQNPEYCYEEAGVYTPVFSIEDEFGCFSDYSVSGLIQISDEFPTIDFTPASQLDCNPSVPIDFTNASTGASDLTFDWDFGDGETLTTTDTDITHFFDDTGVFNVCLHVEDEIGCPADSCIQIEIFSTADSEFDFSTDIVCLGQEITFADLTVPTPVSWSWDFDGDGVEDSNEQNPVFVYPAEGVYNPELTVTYSDNCQDTQTSVVPIDVLEELIVAFTADTLVSCSIPFEVNFTNESTGPGNITYEWTINQMSVAATDDLGWTFEDWGYFDIELIATSDEGCSLSLTEWDLIEVLEPEITFSNPTIICTEDPVPIWDIEVNSVDIVVEWLWDFDEDDIIDYSGPDPDFSYDTPGEYNISVDIITENGCVTTYTSTQTITVETQVNSSFTVSDTLSCAGEALTFCVEEQPGVTYSWNFGDGTGWQTFNSWDTCVVHDYQDTGIFDITLSVFNQGCNHVITFEELIDITGPVALFDVVQDCSDMLTVEFVDNSIDAAELIWDFGDGSPLVYDDLNPIHTYDAPGTYEVSLTAMNDNIVGGCPDTQIFEVIAIQSDNEVTFGPTTGCPPLAVDFDNDNYNVYWEVDFGNGDDMIVEWNNLLAQWVVEWNYDDTTETLTYSPNSNFWPTVIYDELGEYDITVFAIDENGCEQTTIYDNAIEVNSSPDFAFFDIDILEDCDQVQIEFTPTANNLVTWEWQFSDGSIVTDLNPIHVFDPPYLDQPSAIFTATDVAGCTSVIEQEVDMVMPPSPDFEVIVDPSCQGDSIQLVNQSFGDIVTYAWDFGDPESGDANTSDDPDASHIYFQNGSYDICLTVTNSIGCEQTLCQDDIVNIINPIAELNFDASINNCLFGVQFDNITGGTVECSEWDFGDGQQGEGMGVFHTYPIGVFDVELIVCNEYGCYDTLVVDDIFNYANVIGDFEVDLDAVSCAPFQIELEAFNIDDNSFNYFWDFDDGFGDPAGTTITNHEYLEPGVYCPSLIMTDVNGCPVLIECVDSIVVDEFVLDISPLEDICFGDSIMFNVSGGESYTWLDDTYVEEVDLENYWLDPPTSTTFDITGYYSDCVAQETFDLVVNQLPDVTLDLTTEVCFEDAVLELTGGLPDDIPGTYYVDGVEASDFDPSQAPGQTFDVIYEYTDVFGCVNTAQSSILINPLPEVSLEPFAGWCEDAGLVPLTGGAPTGGEFSYDGAPITDFDAALGWGEYDITYTYTDDNGCISADLQPLNIYPMPQLEFGIESNCVTDNLIVFNNSTVESGTIDIVDWDFGILGTSDLFNPDPIELFFTGNYPITLVATSDFGCVSTLTQDFDVAPVPQAEFDLTNDCVGQSFDLFDQSTITDGDIVEWDWTIDGIGTYGDQNISEVIDEWGAYDIQLLVTSDFGCVDSIEHTLEVYPLPDPSFLYADNCVGLESEFVNQSTIPATDITDYEWQLGDGTIIEDIDALHEYANAGFYDVTLVATSEFGCVDSETQTIEIFPGPSAFFTNTESAFCQYGSISFEDESMIEDPYYIAYWQWTVNGEQFSVQQSPEYEANEAGTYDISLTVTSANGCTDTYTAPGLLDIWPQPEANFDITPDQPTIMNPEVTITDESGDVVYWEFDLGDGTMTNQPGIVHTYETWGSYDIWLYVENEFGCVDSIMQTIIIDPEWLVHVPNAFTPDNDGVNDVFYPVWDGFNYTDFNFQIFNRWGEMMFTTTDPQTPWIGDHQNGDYYAPNGVYVWTISLTSEHTKEVFQRSGHVTLIR